MKKLIVWLILLYKPRVVERRIYFMRKMDGMKFSRTDVYKGFSESQPTQELIIGRSIKI